MIHASNPDLPDAGAGMCCHGAALYGPDRCTCWENVYEHEQQPPRIDLQPDTMPSMCSTCAYRPSSPERSGDERAGADTDDLMDLAVSGVFYCHDGMQNPVVYRHPSGVEVPGSALDFSSAPVVADRAYRVDGRPASLCAGWAAMHRKFDAVP